MVDQIIQCCPLCFYCMNHIPPYLFLSPEDNDDVRDIGRHDFRSILLYHMFTSANRMCTLADPTLNQVLFLAVRKLLRHLNTELGQI